MIARRSHNRRGRRRGFGLIEMAITGLMLAAAMAATVQVVGWVAAERRSVARRERAITEVANLMERITARPYPEITAESLAALRLPGPAQASLPGAILGARVMTPTDAPTRKKIVIELRWLDRSGQSEAPVRLVAWSYREGGLAR